MKNIFMLGKQRILILWVYGIGSRVIQEADWEESN